VPVNNSTEDPGDGAPREAAATTPDGLVPLVHSDLRVPHRRLRVTALHQLPTSDGVAFTAEVRLDNAPVGMIENDGHGGATSYVAVNSSPFNWRDMHQFVTACRRNGEPVDEERVLNSLVDEFDLTREIERAANVGLTVVRLMSPQWCLTIRTIAAINTTRLTDLAIHLTNEPAAPAGALWQIWTTGGWRDLATIAGPHTRQRDTRREEPST
jgi:hypothetical protein